MGRLVLLQTSPRLPAGLLSRDAWQALETADVVLAPDVAAPLPDALRAQGIEVRHAPVVATGELLSRAADGTVVWLLEPGDDSELTRQLAAEVVGRSENGSAVPGPRPAPSVELLVGSFDPVGSRLLDLVEVMDVLRRECPWDQQQTHESLLRYLLEETYETVEAVETGDREHLREELGDLLLQVAFHSRIAAEHTDQPFTIDDVAAGIVAKLVRRHPHVFADTEVSGAGDVERNWEAIKAAEKSRGSAMDGIPLGLPALSLAHKVLARADRAGVPFVIRADGVPDGAGAGQLADLLLGVVAAADRLDADPEQLLRIRVRQLMDEVRDHEGRAPADEGGVRR